MLAHIVVVRPRLVEYLYRDKNHCRHDRLAIINSTINLSRVVAYETTRTEPS